MYECVQHSVLGCCVLLDQLFSRIAYYLKRHDAHDRQAILAAIEYGFNAEQYELKPMVSNLDRAANISTWITPYLAKTPNLTQFRQFKLEMTQGKVTVLARTRCADIMEFSEWQNLDHSAADTPAPVLLRNAC